jgi:hypothetical protein
MSKYFFHIHRGAFVLLDEEGMYLPGMDAARAEALLSVGDLARAGIRAGHGPGNSSIEIADELGTVLGSVAVRRFLH